MLIRENVAKHQRWLIGWPPRPVRLRSHFEASRNRTSSWTTATMTWWCFQCVAGLVPSTLHLQKQQFNAIYIIYIIYINGAFSCFFPWFSCTGFQTSPEIGSHIAMASPTESPCRCIGLGCIYGIVVCLGAPINLSPAATGPTWTYCQDSHFGGSVFRRTWSSFDRNSVRQILGLKEK